MERNVAFGMYSGLALLMDVYHPEQPNGYGIVFISGSGWTRELDRTGARQLVGVRRVSPAARPPIAGSRS